MILLIDAEKAFDKIQHPFLIKTLKKVGEEGAYLKITKAKYEKPNANSILNGEILRGFPLRSGTRQGCPLLFFVLMKFIVKLVSIQHPVLIPTGALLNAHHPLPPPSHPQSTLFILSF